MSTTSPALSAKSNEVIGAWKMNLSNAAGLAAGMALAFAVGCSKPSEEAADETAEQEESSTEESGAEGAAAPEAATPDQTFTLNTSVDGGQLIVSVEPSTGYKINEDFPWLLALSDVAPGGAAELTAEDATRFEEAGAQFTIDGSEYAEGDRVEGSLRFAVCNDDVCITRTEELAWNL